MDKLEAGRILERLTGHYQWMVENDAAADDWIRAIQAVSPETGHAAADQLINDWTHERAPRLADWQKACRAIVQRRALEEKTIPAIEASPVDPDRLKELFRQMREDINRKKWLSNRKPGEAA